MRSQDFTTDQMKELDNFLKVSFSQIDTFIEDNFNSIEEFAMVIGGNIVKITKNLLLFGAATGDVLKPIFDATVGALETLVKIHYLGCEL